MAPPPACIGGGLVLTAEADYPGQAIYWELVGVDQDSGMEISPLGSLRWDRRRAGNTRLATNLYLAPNAPWTGNKTDRIKIKAGNDA